MRRMKCMGHRLGLIIIRIKGAAVVIVAVDFFPRGRGWEGNPPRGGRHKVNFCKTQIEERSENGIGNSYQSKGENSINSVTKDKEGVCYFLKSRLLTGRGMVNGKEVVKMHATGCTGCVIRAVWFLRISY